MKKKRAIRMVAAVYCAVLCLVIIATSIPYGGLRAASQEKPMDFSTGWSVTADGAWLADGVALPVQIDDSAVQTIELRNTIPAHPFETAVLETVIFQKDICVYIGGELVLERTFESKNFNQSTPGSGRIFVPLPSEAQGQEIVIQLHKVVLEDSGPVAKISIMNGLMSQRSIISLSSSAFLATVLMFFIGVCLLITCVVYLPMGVRTYSLSTMAMFVIATSLWVMCNSKTLQYFTDNWVLMHNLEYLAFYSMPLWLWLFLSNNWDRHQKICAVAINVQMGFMVLTFSAKVLGICDFYSFLRVFHALAIANIVVILVLGLKDIRRQPIALKIFFLGIGGLCFTSLIDLVRYYTIFSPDAMALFFILGIIFMGICLFLTFIIIMREKLMSSIEDNVYKELAFTDILTGLNSRAKWEADMARIQEQMSDYRSVTTAMLDVNDLKKVNDRYGHHEGDRVLTTVSEALKKRFRGKGRCYRLGGDEFCVIMLNKPLGELVDTLEQVADDLGANALTYPMSFAWGCAQYDGAVHRNLSDTLMEADNYMYEHKRREKETSLSRNTTD